MLDTLGSIIAKILLKKYLGDEAAQIGGGVVDILKGRIKARLERTKTKNVAEEISEEIVERLEGLFEKEHVQGLNAEAVANELGETLKAEPILPLFLTRDLQAEKILPALRERRPLPSGMFSEAETSLYDRALNQITHQLVAVADKLPEFNARYPAESLQRLQALQAGRHRSWTNRPHPGEAG